MRKPSEESCDPISLDQWPDTSVYREKALMSSSASANLTKFNQQKQTQRHALYNIYNTFPSVTNMQIKTVVVPYNTIDLFSERKRRLILERLTRCGNHLTGCGVQI